MHLVLCSEIDKFSVEKLQTLAKVVIDLKQLHTHNVKVRRITVRFWLIALLCLNHIEYLLSSLVSQEDLVEV